MKINFDTMKFNLCYLLLGLVILLTTTSAFAQTKEEKKLLKTVQELYDNGQYEKALDSYKELAKIKPKNFEYQYELALIYFHELNEKEKSIPYFKKANELMKKDSIPELFFLLAQAYQAEGEYEKAIETFYYYRDIDSSFLKVSVKRYVDLCNYGIELLNNSDTTIIIDNLGNPVNTKFDEYTAVNIYSNSDLVFTSRNKKNMFEETIEAIYVSDYNSGVYDKPIYIEEHDLYNNLLVDKEEHSSIVNISKDEQRIIIYTNSFLYSSELIEGKWSDPKKIDDKINFNFSNRHISFTEDGKEVYFSSFDRKNQNNIEIFYSNQNDDGSWTDAIEVGRPINTRKNEDAPEISAQGDTLYFASNGHKGMGGYDIFMSVKTDSVWSKPINMGTPINSPWDDIYYKYNFLKNEGYISSNRKGGMGGMDIYKIRKKQ